METSPLAPIASLSPLRSDEHLIKVIAEPEREYRDRRLNEKSAAAHSHSCSERLHRADIREQSCLL